MVVLTILANTQFLHDTIIRIRQVEQLGHQMGSTKLLFIPPSPYPHDSIFYHKFKSTRSNSSKNKEQKAQMQIIIIMIIYRVYK